MRYQICIALLLAIPSAFAGAAPPAGTSAVVALLETTDLHSNVLGYDYYKLAPDPSLGLDRTATLIAQARKQYPNNLLFDNGDTIQGSALADFQAQVAPLACDKTLAIYKVMNHLGFDGSGIGNHEFNYGLAYLSQVTGSRFDVAGVDPSRPRCAGPAFPQVLANVFSTKTRQPLFAPYRIIDKQIAAVGPDGKPVKVTLKVGIIGFAPPLIMSWDKRWLEGKVYTEGILETARRMIPEMRAKGADLVVAISHGGLDAAAYDPAMENGNYHLAQVPGIDAMLIGHSHQLFPNPASAVAQFNLPGVDKAKGLVHGVPTVMANLWGKHLGVIGLHLRSDGARWVVDRSRTTVEARGAQLADKTYVAPDPAVAALIAEEHEATIRYVKTPVGATDFRMSSYFADVGDVSAIAVVNLAQADYVRKVVQASMPQYAKLPVLSMASPFKGGSAGVTDYTDVPAGALALNNLADLYLYPNALYAVKVNGAELTAWLEQSAGRFNTIDPARTDAQELVNRTFPSYNFDAITSPEVSYEIDLSQAPGKRIRNLRYRGQPVGAASEFLVATNNYRASGGGGFPGLDGSKTILAGHDTNRDVLIEYIKSVKNLTRALHAPARSWRFSTMKTAGPVVFRSAPGLLDVARAAGIDNVTQLREDDGGGKGHALYQIDLSQGAPADPVRQAIASIQKTLEQRPADPTLHYYLASFQARAKERDQAIASLKKVAHLGDGFMPIKDFGFENLKDDAEFQALRAAFDKAAPVVDDATLALRIPDRRFTPEGIAYDAKSRSFFVGSVAQKRIVRVSRSGAIKPFSRHSDELDAILGLAVDTSRRALYAVSTSALTPATPLRNVVVRYDLASGKRSKQFHVPQAQQLNDVAIAPNGDLFASDSRAGGIWRINVASGAVSAFIPAGGLGGTNGLAVSPDGKTLYAAHSTGIVRIDTATAKFEKLLPPERQTVAAIDGLYLWKGDLIGIQNITNPGRVIRIRLQNDGTEIARVETLQSHHQRHFDEPTTGAIADGAIYVLGTTQVSQFNDKGEFNNPAALKEPAVVKVRLDR